MLTNTAMSHQPQSISTPLTDEDSKTNCPFFAHLTRCVAFMRILIVKLGPLGFAGVVGAK